MWHTCLQTVCEKQIMFLCHVTCDICHVRANKSPGLHLRAVLAFFDIYGSINVAVVAVRGPMTH